MITHTTSLSKLEAVIKELDEKYPRKGIAPGTPINQIMFDAGVQEVINFIKGSLGKPLDNPNRLTALEMKEQKEST